jgi:hypothetical protein
MCFSHAKRYMSLFLNVGVLQSNLKDIFVHLGSSIFVGFKTVVILTIIALDP